MEAIARELSVMGAGVIINYQCCRVLHGRCV